MNFNAEIQIDDYDIYEAVVNTSNFNDTITSIANQAIADYELADEVADAIANHDFEDAFEVAIQDNYSISLLDERITELEDNDTPGLTELVDQVTDLLADISAQAKAIARLEGLLVGFANATLADTEAAQVLPNFEDFRV